MSAAGVDGGLSKDEAIVFNYMVQMNRPFSANDVAQNLHRDIAKSAVQKLLDSLTANERLTEKLYGKQKIYFVNQSYAGSGSDVTFGAVQALDTQIEEAEKIYNESQKAVKEAETKLRKLTEGPSVDELKNAVKEWRIKIQNMEAKRDNLKEASSSVKVDKTQRQRMIKYRNELLKEWRSRKRMCMDVVGPVLDGCPMSPEDALSDMGIVTDKEAGITAIPQPK